MTESKIIFITGATDGIGLETARKLKSLGHQVLIHGRSEDKLSRVTKELKSDGFRADLSNLSEVNNLANDVIEKYPKIDILINNAGVYKTPEPLTADGYDVRFLVNTIAPYLLTKKLLSNINSYGRIINLSSAAQASVDFDALLGKKNLVTSKLMLKASLQ